MRTTQNRPGNFGSVTEGDTVTRTKSKPKKSSSAPATRMSLDDVMRSLEKAGSAQTRKTYARHGVTEPMFGVSFATLKAMYKKIRVDQALAEALWNTGNFDARNLAIKIADPANMSSRVLDRWAATPTARMCGGYVGQLAAESPHARDKADKWLAAADDSTRFSGWSLVAAMAMIDESMPDSWFMERLVQIEETVHSVPNAQRSIMNSVIIAIGCRSASLCKAAVAAAKRIGPIDVDFGDTACKAPDPAQAIKKAWGRVKTKGFETPAAQERSREPMRTRC